MVEPGKYSVTEVLRALDKGPADIRVCELRAWMNDPAIEVQGVVFDFLIKSGGVARNWPEIDANELNSFAIAYLGRCIKENPANEWAETRWSACYELASWFGRLWDDHDVPVDALQRIKGFIADAYLEGSSDLRAALTDATLEHLFENASVRNFFADWVSTDKLKEAYERSSEWGQAGASTSLAPRTVRSF